jgi:exonuclease SbcC
MILGQIRLHPFGGASDRSVTFTPGLNVVLGPNEAGKSTLVAALRAALFRTTQLTAVRFRNEMQSYLPVTGGDTLRVTLRFAVDGQTYMLEKAWGASRSSRLSLPGGGELTGPEMVENRLAGFLQFGEGTYNYVLITYQSHLAGTVEELRENPLQSTEVLTSLLQRSIFQSDGVSVERLRMLVKQREEEYFSRWDRQRRGPEGGRDIDRPWGREVGAILKSWYDMRRTERAHAEAVAYEKAMDDFAAGISVLQRDVDSATAYVNAHAPFVADARKRADLGRRLETINAEIPGLKEVQQQWPRNEEQMKRLHDEVEHLREEYRSLQTEQRQTEEFLSQQSRRETFARARIEHDRVADEERRLATLRTINDRDMKLLKDAEVHLKGLQIKIESQKLALRLEARAPFAGRMRTSAGDRDLNVQPGESVNETTRGTFELLHADWSLTVRSATDDALALQEAFETQTARYRELCRRLAVESSEEATAVRRSYDEQKTRVENARAALKALIGKESYESMAQSMEALAATVPGRSVGVISSLMKEVTSQGENKSRDEKELQRQCTAWEQQYTDQDHLLDLLVRRKQEALDLERQLRALAPLPDGIQDAAAYVVDFDRRKDELAAKKEQLSKMLLERAVFEKNEPKESLEETRDRLRDLRAGFEAARAAGESYARIREELERLVGAVDAQTYKPLQDRFERLVDQLTLHRYNGLQMEGPLPVKVKGAGPAFGLNMLSHGTLDVLSLAVRVGMAEYYLDGREGFFLMDDPLVNMDPERQRAAVDCLREFAGRKQTIILTCHPSHAEMLGGNLNQL